jgi:hypothetical protein
MVLKHVHNVVGFLNTNTLFAGIMLLALNIGGRFIIHELEGNDEEYSQNIFLRRLAIFAVCFVGTKDIITSLILTASFVILAGGIFRGLGREGMTNPITSAVVSSGTSSGPYGSAQDKSPGLFEGKR